MTIRFHANIVRLLVLCGTALLPTVAVAQAFGPDAFGYRGQRTNAPGDFTSIKGAGGTLVTPADPAAANYDDRFYAVPIGFAFPIYGTPETQAFVSTNGFISFGGVTNTNPALDTQVAASYNNGNLASASPIISGGATGMQVDRTFVAPWWDDMQFTGGRTGGLYTLTRTAGAIQEFVVEWSDITFFAATNNPITFQSILRSDGSMTFLYPGVTNGATGTNGAEATIGIHRLGGTTANNQFLQFSFNQPGILNNGDRIDILPVPEPGTASLAGIAALGGLMRRRRTS